MDLIKVAETARFLAYAPYSKFKVGAAVLCKNGVIIKGANIEASSSILTIHAEKLVLAICRLQGLIPIEMAIIADLPVPLMPCGACRQFMLDFSPLKVILANVEGEMLVTTANRLLPNRYQRKKAA